MTRCVAFVILTWNSEAYIKQCLNSIIELEGIKKYIYIVDNGSSDKTVSYINSFKDEYIFFLKQSRNLGTTKSRNLALSILPKDVDYVCILDSDTVFSQEALDTLIRVISTNESVGIAGPLMKNSNGEYQLTGRNFPTLGIKLRKAVPLKSLRQKGSMMEVPKSATRDALIVVDYLVSACWMMRKGVLEEVGLLDEKIFYAPEDVDYCMRVKMTGYKCVVCQDAVIQHEYQRISHKKLFSKINIEHLKGLAYYFRKYKYLLNADKAKRTSSPKTLKYYS